MTRRMSVRLILVLVSMLAACSIEPEASVPYQTPAAVKKASSDVLRYTREQDGRRQNLEVRRPNKGAIDVVISISGACTRSEAGRAKAVEDEGDGEVETDPEGEGHSVDEFMLTAAEKCRVSIRLGADGDYAWLREFGCAATCPLSNRAMSRK